MTMNNTKRIILFITILLGQTTISFCENIENQWGLKAIDVPTAWKFTKGDSNIKVALIDYGVETTHPGLRENICGNYNCTPNDLTEDGDHGTNSAGVICATDNDTMVGVAPLCQLSNIKILYYEKICNQDSCYKKKKYDVNWYKKINSEHLLKDIRIINCSWGSKNNVPEEENFLDSLYKNNHIIIVASGNYGNAIGQPSKNVRFPANLSSTLSVGAIDEDGCRLGDSNIYSNNKIYSCYGEELDVVAPGMDILTTTLNGGYTRCTGTSLACPHVAGIAALMLSVNPDLTSEEVYSIIKSTCTKLPNYEFKKDATHIYGTWNNKVGYGLVNAYYAVAAAKAHTTTTIQGNSHLCGVETYTVNIPDSAVVQWSVSNTLVSLVKGQGTKSATFEYKESDDAPYTVTIKAKITYREHSFTLSKTIQVGTEKPFIQMSNTQGGVYVNYGNVGNRYYIYASANNIELSTNSKDYKWSVSPSSDESNKLPIQGNPYVFTPSEEGIYTFNLVYNGDCGEVSISKSYHFYQKDNSGGGTVVVSPNPSTGGNTTITIKLRPIHKEFDPDVPIIIDKKEDNNEIIYSVKSLTLPTFEDEMENVETFFLQVWSNGKLIKSFKSENSNQLDISTEGLTSGIYQLVVILENGEFYGSTQLIVY